MTNNNAVKNQGERGAGTPLLRLEISLKISAETATYTIEIWI